MTPSYFAGFFDALAYYYGGPQQAPSALTVLTAPDPAGAGAVTLIDGQSVLADGTVTYPLSTDAPVLIGGDGEQETVTPSAVTNPTSHVPGQAGFTATFTKVHGIGTPVRSATCGLQECVNDAIRRGGGQVCVSAAWAAAGGTQAMIDNVVLDSPVTVTIVDNRT